jgi:hypothetical protein
VQPAAWTDSRQPILDSRANRQITRVGKIGNEKSASGYNPSRS